MYGYNPNRKEIAEVKILKLETHRLYPPKTELTDAFLKRPNEASFRIDQNTPIASIGSCFAREIKIWLKENGYNYLQTAHGPCTEAGSARYDRVYNTFSIRQEFERAFDSFDPLVKLWRFEEDGRERLLDPHRHCVAWDNDEDMHNELIEHKAAVKKAFSEAEVIIITVGQAEIWYDTRDGVVFPMAPPAKVFDREIHGFRISTFAENLANLEAIYSLLKAHNPKAHLIVTVSPVPLLANFQPRNSVEANCASKSMLRAAVEEFVQNHGSDVSYFPAYEVVTCTHDDPFEADARHVQRTTVNSIMNLFEHRFLRADSKMSDQRLIELGNTAMKNAQWTNAAGHFEELNARIKAYDPPEQHPLWGVIDQTHQALGEAYMKLERFQDAYSALARALETTPRGTNRYYHLLNQVAAFAMDLQDIDNVQGYIDQILSDVNAPVDMFIHYVQVIEGWYNRQMAKEVLSLGTHVNPNVRQHPDFAQLNARLNAPVHSTSIQATTPPKDRTKASSESGSPL